MDLTADSFEFEYVSGEILFGRGSVQSLDSKLREYGYNRAMVVCGTNVGANTAVMDPVTSAIESRLVDVFDETTPEKDIETVFDGVDRLNEGNIDVIVAIGSGSTLNVARAMSSISAANMSKETVVTEAIETGKVPSADETIDPIPLFVIPTTLAGADISAGGTITLDEDLSPKDDGGRPTARNSDPRLMAEVLVYDPELFVTTPTSVLTSSAMNGFNKGIETLYSRKSNPISIAHAFRGLQHFRTGVTGLASASLDSTDLDHSVIAIILVQYGKFTNIIHTFGNGVSVNSLAQQGTVHGIMAPHVLRYVFSAANGNRRLVASGLGLDTAGKTDEQVGDMIVEDVIDVRDSLELPTHLREIDELRRSQLPTIAEAIVANPKHERNPVGIDPTPEDIMKVLEQAW